MLDAGRFERSKEVGVFPGRHHADEATKAQPGCELPALVSAAPSKTKNLLRKQWS